MFGLRSGWTFQYFCALFGLVSLENGTLGSFSCCAAGTELRRGC